MRLSILVITRKRPYHLSQLLDSIRKNAYDLNNFELVLGYDSDDADTQSVLENYPELNIRHLVYNRLDDRPINKHSTFLNPMALSSNCDYIWVLNDDTIIETPNFDKHLIQELDSFMSTRSSGLLYAKVNETLSADCIDLKPIECECDVLRCSYACYPILSNKTIQILGFFVPPEISNHGADIHLSNIFHYSLANVFVEVKSVAVKDFRVSPVGDSNHIHVNSYNYESLRRDVKKINDYIMSNKYFEEQKVAPCRIQVSIIIKCKGCNSELHIGNNFMHSMTVCNMCGAPNIISNYTRNKTINLDSIGHRVLNYLYLQNER